MQIYVYREVIQEKLSPAEPTFYSNDISRIGLFFIDQYWCCTDVTRGQNKRKTTPRLEYKKKVGKCVHTTRKSD